MRRAAATIAAFAAIAAAACTAPAEPPPPSPSRSFGPAVEVVTGETSTADAMRTLCESPDIVVNPVNKVPTPASIAEVQDQVEAVRGLEFQGRVNVEPVTPDEIDRRLSRYLETYYPDDFYARRSDAWGTIGVIPPGVQLKEAYDAYQQGQVLGYYDSQNGELVYTGDADLDRIEHFVLAHELTHAMDDQHFDLDRLDDMAVACDDEPFSAALGIVEGSANHFATQVLIRFPNATAGSLPEDDAPEVPPFIVALQAYPYTYGQRFADALADRGGTEEIDGALETFPVSTEQVLHPDRFPDDVPVVVDVPDFGPTFGEGWRDLDAMEVGEMWLRAMLNLRIADAEGESAAAGWDGAVYRAWTDGDDVAVVLSSEWDSPREAREFRAALASWIAEGSAPASVLDADGTRVHAGFATSEEIMPALVSALRSL